MDLDAELVKLLNQSIFSEEVFRLIELGANPNLLNESGYSLFHILIFNRLLDQAFKLAENERININIKDHHGFPPLYYMLNEKYTVDHIANMVRLGANPNIKNKQGKAPIHFLIRDSFLSALKLLQLHPSSIHLKDAEGTPLQIMLNMRHIRPFTADSYLTMIRLGADPETVDNQGTSLLNIIISIDSLEKAKELVALSKISPKDRINYTPKIVDYFIADGGLELLLHLLKQNHPPPAEIAILAKYPLAKEMVIQFIKTLEPEEQEVILTLCFKPKSSLNQFFSVQRGWFMTSNSRGSFAQLMQMQQKLNNTTTPEPEMDEDDKNASCCLW